MRFCKFSELIFLTFSSRVADANVGNVGDLFHEISLDVDAAKAVIIDTYSGIAN